MLQTRRLAGAQLSYIGPSFRLSDRSYAIFVDEMIPSVVCLHADTPNHESCSQSTSCSATNVPWVKVAFRS